MKWLTSIICGILLFSNCMPQVIPEKEEYIEVQGGKIWCKIIGDGSGIPLIVVHGGPGGRSCGEIAAFSLMADERPVIFFDQLESGFSDRPNDTSLWKLPYFVDQLAAVKEALDLKKYHLLGSSWGAAVVMEYMLTEDTEGATSVVFAGPYLSTPIWMKDAKALLAELPDEIQDTIAKYEALKQYDAPAYLAATDSFYIRYLVRTGWPTKASEDCNGAKPFNKAIYNYMWGPTEFNAIGILMDFDRTDRLHELNVPVLFVVGEFDEVRIETMYRFQQKVKGAKSAIIPGAGHAKAIDNPEEYIKALSNFLSWVETDSSM